MVRRRDRASPIQTPPALRPVINPDGLASKVLSARAGLATRCLSASTLGWSRQAPYPVRTLGRPSIRAAAPYFHSTTPPAEQRISCGFLRILIG